MKLQTTILLVMALTGCAGQAPMKPGVDPQILGELSKPSERRPGPRTEAVERAMLPPLRMEMPSVRGRPIDPRFDLSVNNAPAGQVFMSLVSGTRYSMLVHPSLTGTITLNLKDVTLQEALDAIRDLYGYDYKVEGARIMIQPAGMQTRIFKVNYILGDRRGLSGRPRPVGLGHRLRRGRAGGRRGRHPGRHRPARRHDDDPRSRQQPHHHPHAE